MDYWRVCIVGLFLGILISFAHVRAAEARAETRAETGAEAGDTAEADWNADGLPDRLELVAQPDKTQTLQLILGGRKALALSLPRFWSPTDFDGIGADSTATLEAWQRGNQRGFLLRIEGGGDDALRILARFRWQEGRFLLIGETHSAHPQVSLPDETGQTRLGRLACERDRNLLTGAVLQVVDGKRRRTLQPSAKLMPLAEYRIEADYLEDFCH